jgi:hypothetical protein
MCKDFSIYFDIFEILSKETQSEWRVVFYISAIIFLIGCVVYALFGSAEQEKWTLDNEEERCLISNSVDPDLI